MRILLFSHCEFFDERDEDLKWIGDFEESLRVSGHHVERFDPETHKIREYDILHFFSRNDPELWSTIARFHPAVVVTPALSLKVPRQISFARQTTRFALRLCRAMVQRRWPPFDETFWFSSARLYLVLNRPWAHHIETRWAVPGKKLRVLPSDPKQAARVAEELYISLT